jgi:hypothetical protein
MGRRPIAVGLAALLLAIIAAGAIIAIRGLGWTPGPQLTVQITPAVSARSADDRGTDAWATITNSNAIPVDVTVRVQGFDISRRPFIEKRMGPFRHLPPGGSRDIQVHLDTTPLESVTVEPFAAAPTAAETE